MPAAVILAAGYGSRMRSSLPKAMHRIAGQPMLRHLLARCAPLFERMVVVVGPDMRALADLAAPHAVVVQQERLGTAHAALQAAGEFGQGDVAILYADNPLIETATLQRLLQARRNADLALLAMRPPDPGRYGRVVVEDGRVRRIVEHADATEAERALPLCNAGVFCAAADHLRAWLSRVQPSAGGEYYLTDIVPHAGHTVAVEADFAELRGINTRAELADAEQSVQQSLRAAAMREGATLTDPASIFLAYDTAFSRDVVVHPHVVFGPGVALGEGAEIRSFSHLEGCVVEAGAIIGPFARLRPGSVVERSAHVGNFCELKAARLGAGAKLNHLSYVGDASIGARSNIGAGTITCNYDGTHKHRTEIGADVFVGSHTTLVAPVRVEDGAFIAAGSVITETVEADSLALGRARQVNKQGAARRLRRVKEQG